MDAPIWSQLNLDLYCVVDGKLILVAPIRPNLDRNKYIPGFAHLMPNAVYTHESVDPWKLDLMREEYNEGT